MGRDCGRSGTERRNLLHRRRPDRTRPRPHGLLVDQAYVGKDLDRLRGLYFLCYFWDYGYDEVGVRALFEPTALGRSKIHSTGFRQKDYPQHASAYFMGTLERRAGVFVQSPPIAYISRRARPLLETLPEPVIWGLRKPKGLPWSAWGDHNALPKSDAETRSD